MPKHFTVPDFWEGYGILPTEIQKLADRCYALLKASPDHPSLQFKKVGKVFSVRVGLHYRAMATPLGEDFLWFWIGTHAEYDLLMRRVS